MENKRQPTIDAQPKVGHIIRDKVEAIVWLPRLLPYLKPCYLSSVPRTMHMKGCMDDHVGPAKKPRWGKAALSGRRRCTFN